MIYAAVSERGDDRLANVTDVDFDVACAIGAMSRLTASHAMLVAGSRKQTRCSVP